MKKRTKGILCGVLAAALTISGVSMAFLTTPNTPAYAKETLQSITDIVNETTEQKPYTLLEIIPDKAYWTYNYTDRNENSVALEVAQNMGQVGYFFKGQEPVIQDLIHYFSDESDVVMNESSVRKEFAKTLLLPLVGENYNSSSAIVTWDDEESAPIYYDARGYRELREGEVISQYALNDELNEKDKESSQEMVSISEKEISELIEKGQYYPIKRQNDEEMEQETGATSDYAYGKMQPSYEKIDAGEWADYNVTYIPREEADPARIFLGNDNKGQENSNFKPINQMLTESGDVTQEVRGEFDPYLLWDEDSGITDDDRIRYNAVFQQDSKMRSGYRATDYTLVEFDAEGKVTNLSTNTPLYVRITGEGGSELLGYYGYVKEDGTIENDGLTDEEIEDGDGDDAEDESDSDDAEDESGNDDADDDGGNDDADDDGGNDDVDDGDGNDDADDDGGNDDADDDSGNDDADDDGGNDDVDDGDGNDDVDDGDGNDDVDDDDGNDNVDDDDGNDNVGNDDADDDVEPGNDLQGEAKAQIIEEQAVPTASFFTQIRNRITNVENRSVDDNLPNETEEELSSIEEETVDDGSESNNDKAKEEQSIIEETSEVDETDGMDEAKIAAIDTSLELYTVKFVYSDDDEEDQSLYRIVRFTEDSEGQYTLPAEGSCLCLNDRLLGTIKLQDPANWEGMNADNFLYEYVPSEGYFDWTGEAWLPEGDNVAEYQIQGADIIFATGLDNKDWFKQNVFDREPGKECDDLHVYVTTVFAADYIDRENEFKNLVTSHSMVLLLDGATDFYGGDADKTVCRTYGDMNDYGKMVDIPASVFISIIMRAVEEGTPVVSDYHIANANGVEKSNDILAARLVRALNLNDLEAYYVTLPRDNDTLIGNENPMDFGTYRDVNEYHNVNRNVYTYNGGGFAGYVPFVNGDWLNVFSSNVVTQAFSEVLVDIEAENLYRKADGDKPLLSTDITQAAVIRYIIGYPYKRSAGVKESIHVLELEPAASYDLQLKEGSLYKKSGKELKEWIKPTEENVTIQLTQMTTSEYIGHIEDANITYDLIYIGINTEMMNTDAATGKTTYNDASMNGLIYSNVGDYIFAKPVMAGLMDYDYVNNDRSQLLRGWNDIDIAGGSTLSRYRYSGNDITQERMENLEEYVRAGYPLVLADDLLVIDDQGRKNVNTELVDNSSYMYQYIQSIKDKDNVFMEKYITEDIFDWFLNLQKPQIRLYGVCNEAQYSTIGLTQAAQGGYYASYEFIVNNLGAAEATSSFDCKLFVDINADGKYSPTTEEITYLSVVDSYGESAPYEGGKYQLRTGQKYYASFKLAETYEGVIPWKLEVVQNDNIYRKTAAIGYYEVFPETKIPIDILQIKSNGSGIEENENNWDMAEDLQDPTSRFYRLMNDNRVHYDVDIDSVFAYEFDAVATDPDVDDYQEYLSYLEKYDMLIMGFADCFIGPNMVATNAIREYIARGNSILFTHDTTSFINVPEEQFEVAEGYAYPSLDEIITEGWMWGYEFNTQIRNLVGMDRYNVLNGPTYSNATYAREVPYKPGSGKTEVLSGETQGFTYHTLTRYAYGNPEYQEHPQENEDSHGTKFPTERGYTKNMKLWDKAQYEDSYVTRVNSGQVTTYPYVLEEEFPVATTHSQYYQLDLTADDDFDGESDIVVWYCLGGTTQAVENDIYELSPNDVRNNYYIYNKGNITYSGVGHSAVTNEQEMKLFVNTLIAAYRAGMQKPILKLKAGYEENARAVKNIYISYDRQLELIEDDTNSVGGLLTATDELFFTTETTSLIQNANNVSRKLRVQLYYEVPPESESYDRKVAVGTEYVYLNALPLGEDAGAWDYDTGLYTLAEDGVTEVLADKNDLVSGKTYRLNIPTMGLVKNQKLWETPETISSLQALNERRIYIVITEQAQNLGSGKITSNENQSAVSLVRVQLFDLD